MFVMSLSVIFNLVSIMLEVVCEAVWCIIPLTGGYYFSYSVQSSDDTSERSGKRKHDAIDNGHSEGSRSKSRKTSQALTEEEKDRILEMVENEPEAEAMNETTLKRTILQFEKRVYRNQEMRIKYPDQPEKWVLVNLSPFCSGISLNLLCKPCLLFPDADSWNPKWSWMTPFKRCMS